MASSGQYIFANLSGSLSKELTLYFLKNKEVTDPINCLVIPIPEEDLKALKDEVKNNDWKMVFESIKHSCQHSIEVGLHKIVTLSYADLATNAGASLGSLLANGVMLGLLGPPALTTVPIYFLAEGSIKSLGAFIGNQWSKQNSRHPYDPILLDALEAILEKMQSELLVAKAHELPVLSCHLSGCRSFLF